MQHTQSIETDRDGKKCMDYWMTAGGGFNVSILMEPAKVHSTFALPYVIVVAALIAYSVG